MAHTAARAGATFAGLLAIALLCQPAHASADHSAALREGLHRDIYVVITLAGYHCGGIGTVVENGPSDYSVQCRNGKRFRVHTTADEIVHVVDRSPGVGPAPLAPADHRSLAAQSLFAIVNLSGQDCDEVVGSERAQRFHYRVWCGNETHYRISVTADGRVAVERIR